MKILLSSFLLGCLPFFFIQCSAQKPVNWTPDQLMEPSVLALKLESNTDVPLIYCVGPGVVIPNSIDIGMTDKKENVDKFKNALQKISKNTDLVIYCGCCPFDHCPNVRPAIEVLKQLNFTNYHLLNLPDNIKKDWIDKGYPVVKDNKEK